MPARQVGMCASCAATQLRTPPASATRLRTLAPLTICANAGSAVRNSVLGEKSVRNRVPSESSSSGDAASSIWRRAHRSSAARSSCPTTWTSSSWDSLSPTRTEGTSHMNMQEAMAARHTVRKFDGRSLDDQELAALEGRVELLNHEHGTHMVLVHDDGHAFGALLCMTLARGVRDYVALMGPEDGSLDEALGWCSSDLMLHAQTLGLNSWWVGGTFSRGGASRAAGMAQGEKLVGIVCVGHGLEQGRPHRSKRADQVSSYAGEEPEWFRAGVEAALLAPTAINRQAFMLEGSGRTVHASYAPGALAGVDLGIVRHHFELGAGRENFDWA